MDVEHRITFNTKSAATLRAWARFGFKVVAGLNTVVVRESHRYWSEIEKLATQDDCADFALPIFSAAEVDGAPAVVVEPAWHHGYPRPDDDFGYLNITYDLREYCSHCGGGLHQAAPFRMRGEPKWGRRNVLQLNWVFDELFVQPEFWRRALEPLGVAARPVLHHRSLAPLSTVVQVTLVDKVGLEMGDWPFEDCPSCSRRKFLPHSRSYMPKPAPFSSLARSDQKFGSGASSWSRILCSQELRQALVAADVQGITFAPCRR